MDNIYDKIDEGNVYEKPDSPVQEPKYENQGAIYENPDEVQVHASRDYMDTSNEDQGKRSHSSSSSSDSEEEKAEVKVEEPQPEVQAEAEEPHREMNGSRRSSASSTPSSPGDPCDDPPIQLDEDNAEDGMLMAYTHTEKASEPEEAVDYSLKTLENVSLDESSAAPADPNQPDIALFVKVRKTVSIKDQQENKVKVVLDASKVK